MSQSPEASSFDMSALPYFLGRAGNLMGEDRYQEAIAELLSVRHLVSRDPLACNALAFMFLQVDAAEDALVWFDAALALNPDYAQAVVGRGIACRAVGDFAEALLCYDREVAFRPMNAESWYHRGLVLAELGRPQDALASLDRAISLKGDYGQAFAKRSQVIEQLGNLPAAIASALHSCQMSPDQPSSWSRLGDLLQKSGDLGRAIAAYDKGLSLFPDDFTCLCNKAQALEQAGLTREALTCAQDALRLDPANREAFLLCGNLEQELGNTEAAHICFLTVARMGVVRSFPAARQPAKFRALMLFSPEAGNTPYEDLIQGGSFDADLIIVLPDHRYDPAVIGKGADVVVNLVSETDFGLDVVLAAAELVDSLQKPVINHPRLILQTDRESISRRLADVAGAMMPATMRIRAADLCQRLRSGEACQFPLIVRHSATHGGEKMELVAATDTLLSFAEEAGDHDLYLTQFVDYRSTDGFFRKYRFVFVGEDILPYHLAIGDMWKVHHASTRMGDIEWMRREEQRFLDEPAQVFGPAGMAALDAIRRQIGLDYFGIDCSVDAQGRVVVFEVNASMLIHLRNEGFEYKTPHVQRIKASFERLLEQRSRPQSGIRTAGWAFASAR